MSAYQTLEQRFKQMRVLQDAASILSWDDQVMMPSGAAEARGEQLAELAGMGHAMMTAPDIAELLAAADAEQLTDWQAANLREMRHHHRHATAVPERLVAELTKASHASENNWRVARKANDFASFALHLNVLLPLLREKAQAKAAALGCGEYDALLDGYDPGMREATIDAAFAPLRGWLPELIGAAVERQKSRPAPSLRGNYPAAAQKRLGEQLMRAVGFDFARGRLDVSAHPFCGGGTDDVRITTRYDETEPLQAQFGVLHETGHALYEQQLPKDWQFQPVGEARGMSMHESQSLFVEMQIARSRPFAEFAAPYFAAAFDRSDLTAEAIYANATRVRPGLIRVNADEVTYPAHILLRYKLEKALLADELAVADLPGAWAGEMQALLGITPDSDADGCMQDVHWPGGDIGYFPTYALGHMIAAQLKAAMLTDVPDYDARIAAGDFAPVTRWLGEKVHMQGSRYPTMELLQRATGETLNPTHYETHLRNRYLCD